MREIHRQVRKLALSDGRFAPEAFVFLLDSLEPAVNLAGFGEAQGTDRHITGQQLVAGLREEARRLFGPLSAHVWRSWGVRETLDWGHIVFLLVGEGLLNRRETDTIDHFRESFDFDEFFVRDYRFELPAEIGPAAAEPCAAGEVGRSHLARRRDGYLLSILDRIACSSSSCWSDSEL